MSRNRILKEYEIVEGKGTHVEVSLSYELGGWNYFTGTLEGRGLYIHVSPVEKSDGWRSFTAFSGIKSCVKTLHRFNKKNFESFVPEQSIIDKCLNHVLTKNNITLKENEEA